LIQSAGYPYRHARAWAWLLALALVVSGLAPLAKVYGAWAGAGAGADMRLGLGEICSAAPSEPTYPGAHASPVQVPVPTHSAGEHCGLCLIPLALGAFPSPTLWLGFLLGAAAAFTLAPDGVPTRSTPVWSPGHPRAPPALG